MRPVRAPRRPAAAALPFGCTFEMSAADVCTACVRPPDNTVKSRNSPIHLFSVSISCAVSGIFQQNSSLFSDCPFFVCCVKCTVFRRSFCALPVGGSGGSKCLFFPGSKCLDLVHIIYIAEKQLFDFPVIPFLHPFGRDDAKNGRIYLFGKKIIFTFVLVLCTNTVYIFSVLY